MFGSAFGASSTPAFGASSTPAFGASSTPAFGASSTPAFGASSTPAFGASSTLAFGATPAPAFGATTTTAPAFGASTPAFGSSTPTPSAFGSAPPPLFGAAAATPAFGTAAPPSFGATTTTPAFGTTSTPAFSLAPTPISTAVPGATGTGQAPLLVTVSGLPATHSTKWVDLHETSRQKLLAMEEVILTQRDKCRQLDAHTRLSAAAVPNIESKRIQQSLQMRDALRGVVNAIQASSEALVPLRDDIMQQVRETEAAVRSFQRCQQRRAGEVPSVADNYLESAPTVPSTYLSRVLDSMEAEASEFLTRVRELEELAAGEEAQRRLRHMKRGGGQDPVMGEVEALPFALKKLHDYLIHVAAKAERVHERTSAAKLSYLQKLRQRGDMSDPFEDAQNKEAVERIMLSDAGMNPAQLPVVGAGVAGVTTTMAAPAGASPLQQQTSQPSSSGLLFGASTTTPSLGGGMGGMSGSFLGATSTPASASGGGGGALDYSGGIRHRHRHNRLQPLGALGVRPHLWRQRVSVRRRRFKQGLGSALHWEEEEAHSAPPRLASLDRALVGGLLRRADRREVHVNKASKK